MKVDKSEKVFLGVDGGGTSLRACLMSSSGQILATSEGSSANPISVGDEAAFSNLRTIVEQCTGQVSPPVLIESAAFALAGISTRRLAQATQQKIVMSDISRLISSQIIVTNDTFAALWEGASRLPAMVLVSGTGSHCLGIDDLGRVERAFGMEYLLSDEGSAYYMGDRVLRAVTRAQDGRGAPTTLTASVFAYLGVSSLSELYDRIYPVSSPKQLIASYGVFATAAAEAGDQVALDIVNDAVKALSEGVWAVAAKLDIVDAAFDVVTIGAVFRSRIVQELFAKQVLAQHANAHVQFSQPYAALGAAKIARDQPLYDIWRCYES